jgi:uncharacterized protein YkwD
MKAATHIAIALFLSGAICPAELTLEEKQKASTLYKEFKASAGDLSARTSLVSQMLEMGEPVAKVIHPIIDREFRTAAERYRTGFENQTKSVASRKDSREKRDRIKKLRASVQSLRRIKDLKKETIVTVGDPAISELRKLTKLDRQEVLASSEPLAKARADLLELGKQRNACLDALLIVEIDPFQPEALVTEETQIASAALGVDRDARKILSQNEKLAGEIEPAEAAAIRDLNDWRMLVGLSPCIIDPRLCAAARGHSKDMKEKGFFAHESPVSGKEDPWKRAKLEGTSANSENIYAGIKKGADANRGWWHSPGHHKNMLAPGMRRVGMGLYGSHWTQMFGG